MLKTVITTVLALLAYAHAGAQDKINITEALPLHTNYFTLTADYEIEGNTREILSTEVARHQFVGLAELHNSQQLGYFTRALIPLLSKADFKHMALEMGHHQVAYLEAMSKSSDDLTESIRKTNQQYGSKLLVISPLVFADRVEDAAFLEAATSQGLQLHGLDQEHLFSFEMQFDNLYALATDKTEELTTLYEKSTDLVKKWNRKEALKPKFKMACSLKNNELIAAFLDMVNQNEATAKQIADIQTSWEIYCTIESGQNSNQTRANLMKSRFDQILIDCKNEQDQPKVFLKFGSIHLTKGTSLFGVEDIGKHVFETAEKTGSGFLNIRHLKRFRNGKDLIGKNGWKNSTNFMKMGKKDEWTLIDLRPLRQMLAQGKLICSKSEAFEINSYDFIVVSPNDRQARKNF